jgi:hypothetical protein
MFTVEIKTNQPWQLFRKLLQADAWVNVTGKTFSSQKDAEIQQAWIANEFESFSHLLNDFKVESRILSGDEVVWSKEELYNSKLSNAN